MRTKVELNISDSEDLDPYYHLEYSLFMFVEIQIDVGHLPVLKHVSSINASNYGWFLGCLEPKRCVGT